MARPVRRRLEPNARRQELVEAAERLLRERGAAVRIDDVIRAADTARGTFYLYFPTWDDLLEAVRERITADFDAAYPLPVETTGPVDWPRVLDWLTAAFMDFTLELGGLHEAVFHGDFAERRPPRPDQDAIGRLTAIIRAGQEAGAFDVTDAEPTARLLFATLHEAVDAVIEGGDRDRHLAAARRILHRALARSS